MISGLPPTYGGFIRARRRIGDQLGAGPEERGWEERGMAASVLLVTIYGLGLHVNSRRTHRVTSAALTPSGRIERAITTPRERVSGPATTSRRHTQTSARGCRVRAGRRLACARRGRSTCAGARAG